MRTQPFGNASIAAVLLGLAAVAAIPAASAQQARSTREVMAATMPAVVMVLAADIVDGRVQPIASASGTIVTPDGSIITNHHVLAEPGKNRLFDLFVIGRFRRADQEPELVCAGRPAGGKLEPSLDLALIKCEVDLEGRPIANQGWPTVPIGDSRSLLPGEEITVIGYPGIGGSTIHVTSGKLSGWSGEQGGGGRAYIKTDAHISHGNSGGTAVNESGQYIGVPTAFRVDTEEVQGVVATSAKVGLIRPIEHAEPLIALARTGFTPGEGPGAAVAVAGFGAAAPAAPAAAAPGVTVFGKIVDAANGKPVPGAFVVVFKPGVTSGQLDFDRIDEQALTYGQANERGEFELEHPVPRGGAYMVAAVAEGYHPIIEDGVLRIGAGTPVRFDPWGEIRLERSY